MKNLKLKKVFLYLLIASVSISALLAIWVILADDFGDFQGRVLATTLSIVATSILGLACGAFGESAKAKHTALKIIPFLGTILTLVCAFTILGLIWELFRSQDSNILKTIAVSGIFAFSLSQLSLLSLANLSKNFRWSLTAAYIVVLGLASLISAIIIIEPRSEETFIMRLIGVLSIIDGSLTVIIPIFHYLSRKDFANPTIAGIDAEISKLNEQILALEKKKESLPKN